MEKHLVSSKRHRVGLSRLLVVAAVCLGACGEETAPSGDESPGGQGPDEQPGSERLDAGPRSDARVLDATPARRSDASPVDLAPAPGDSAVASSDGCAALAIAQSKCASCHGEQLAFGAPMPLISAEDFRADAVVSMGEKVVEVAARRLHDVKTPMPPKNAAQLSSDELATLDAWLAAGAPAPQATCAPPASSDAGMDKPALELPPDCDEKFKLLANDDGKPHTVPANFEGYHQFYYDLPWGTDDVQAVVFDPIVDNARVLHHYILYQGESSYLSGWSPGKEAKVLPSDIGVYMPKQGQLKLEIHYYNTGNQKAELDQSGVEICITRTPRKNVATTFPFSASATAPAGQRHTSEYLCTVDAKEPVHLFTSAPHMHKLGVHAKLEILRKGGKTELVHDLPFDFHDQNDYPIDFVLNDGDQVKTTCVYENQTTRNVSFGTSSDAEMCFNFAMYYPLCAFSCAGSNPLIELIKQSQGNGCPTTASGSGGFLGL
jgi:mono/diheme cytochrome c family protein